MVSHVSTLSDSDILAGLIENRLRILGIGIKNNGGGVGGGGGKGGNSRNLNGNGGSKRLSAAMAASWPSTPSYNKKKNKSVVVFGKGLRDLPRIYVPLNLGESPSEGPSDEGPSLDADDTDDEILVPTFLVHLIEFLKDKKDKEGIFRLSGSESRQRNLRSSIESSFNNSFNSVHHPTEPIHAHKGGGGHKAPFTANWENDGVSVLDAASLLKQWLRELPEPIIPQYYQEILANCCALTEGQDLDEALLLAACLLPESSSTVVTYLFRFLSSVADLSYLNKMDSKNLAIVLTPSIFPVSTDPSASTTINKKNIASLETAKNQLTVKTLIVEKFIQFASKICMIDGVLEEAYNQASSIPALTSQSEDNLDDDEKALGPSARRSRKKKKRRSGSLSRVLTATMKGIQKAISRSATPAATGSVGIPRYVIDTTPFTPSLDSPRLLNPPTSITLKRKAANENDLSPNSKYRKSALESTVTPKVRGRTFSVKRFKRKKSITKINSVDGGGGGLGVGVGNNSSNTQLVNFSPLPSKSSFLSAKTPGTPDVLHGSGLNRASTRDISDDDDGEMREVGRAYPASAPSVRKSHSNVAVSSSSSSSSSSSNGGRPSRDIVRRKSSDLRRQHMRSNNRNTSSSTNNSRNSPERKIGIVRKRSSKRVVNHELQQQQQLNDSKLKRGMPNTLKSGLAKPSPIRIETPGQKPRIKMSFRETTPTSAAATKHRRRSPRMEKTDSLASLKKDISSIIESSFGLGDESQDATSSFNLGVQELISKMKAFEMTNDKIKGPPSPMTRGALRRQSSAFEFARPSFGLFHGGGSSGTLNNRRQSSAFEIGKAAKEQHIYENFDRSSSTRASLRRKNSSVKDLIRRIESKKSLKKPSIKKKDRDDELLGGRVSIESLDKISIASLEPHMATPSIVPETLPPITAPQSETVSLPKTPIGGGEAEAWVDATEFFKDPNTVPELESGTSSCKRSSIIRIRNENRGKVSKSVETFTRPKNPPMMGIGSSTASSAQKTRRLSARMGVSSCTSGTSTTVVLPPSTTAGGRRPALTGIRTNSTAKRSTPGRRTGVTTTTTPLTPTARLPNTSTISHNNENVYANISVSSSTTLERKKTRRNNSDKRTGDKRTRKSRRLQGRRHLTIGYEGEQIPRSPLRDRQNVVVTVQRSKSAQTPNHPVKKNKASSKKKGSSHNVENVHRSQSMKQQEPGGIFVPSALKETIYDSRNTPSKNQVKRNLSDRVMTPNKGGLRNENVPYIKTALRNKAQNTPMRSSTPHKLPLTPSYKLIMSTSDTLVRKSPRLAKMY